MTEDIPEIENPFADADPWEVSLGRYLGEGNHVVTIKEAEDASAQNGNPQIALTFENSHGTKRDWCNYSGEFTRKVVALYVAAGLERPGLGDFDPGDNYRLSEQAISRLVGKTIGIVIRPEPDFKDPSKMVDRVQGYAAASAVDGSPDTRGLPPAGQQAMASQAQQPVAAGVSSAPKPGEPDIPF